MLSVITPSYNQGAFIADCIESVIHQGVTDVEHIIIDNESTDDTISVCNRYSHRQQFIVVSEPDRGQSDALNKGIRRARGAWILWLNADDYLLPGAINAFMAAIKQQPKANIAYGHTLFVREDRSPIKTVYHLAYRYPYSYFGAYNPPSTGAFFRADLLKTNLLDVAFHYTMDSEWYLRCGQSLTSAVINRPISAFRVSDYNKTSANVRYGTVTPAHEAERQAYRERHIYPRRGLLPHQIHRKYLSVGRAVLVFLLRARKLRYAQHYLRQRLWSRSPTDA